jgi:hypothetical protein
VTPGEPPTPATLDTVFSIVQVAKMAGWSVSRMRRHLVAKHLELGGALLYNVGRGTRRPRWTITLRALHAIAPQWFIDPESMQRQVEWLTRELDATRANMEALSKRVTLQHERLVSLARVTARAS